MLNSQQWTIERIQEMLADQEQENDALNDQDLFNRTPLHVATEKGNLEVVEQLLTRGAALDMQDQWGSTPLHRAAIKGSLEVVQCLVTKGSNCEAEDQWGKRAIHMAASNGHLNIVEYLVGQDEEHDVNRQDRHGHTPLHLAAEQGQVEVVRYLVQEKKATLNLQDPWGRTPLDLAVSNSNLEVVQCLMEAESPNADDASRPGLLHRAVEKGSLSVVQYLLNKKVQLNGRDPWNETPLHIAVRKGDLEVVTSLVEAGAQLDCYNKRNDSPLDVAVNEKQKKMFKYLVQKADQAWIMEQLVQAIRCGNVGFVQYVVDAEVDLNAADPSGNRPLHSAVEKLNSEIVQLLLKHGARLDVQDNQQRTPLQIFQCADNTEKKEAVIKVIESFNQDKGPDTRKANQGEARTLKEWFDWWSAWISPFDSNGKFRGFFVASAVIPFLVVAAVATPFLWLGERLKNLMVRPFRSVPDPLSGDASKNAGVNRTTVEEQPTAAFGSGDSASLSETQAEGYPGDEPTGPPPVEEERSEKTGKKH